MAGAMVQSEARRYYVLVGHSPAFDCGPDYNGRTFVEEEAATFHLFTNGSLRGSFPGQNVSTIHRVYPSVKVTNTFNILSAHYHMKLYII